MLDAEQWLRFEGIIRARGGSAVALRAFVRLRLQPWDQDRHAIPNYLKIVYKHIYGLGGRRFLVMNAVGA